MATLADERIRNEAMKDEALEYINADSEIKKLQEKQKIRAELLRAYLSVIPSMQLDCGDGFYVKLEPRSAPVTWSEKIIAWLEAKGFDTFFKKIVDDDKLAAGITMGTISEKEVQKFRVEGKIPTPSLKIVRPK